MAVTKASPETSSSGRFSGSMRPAHRPLSKIHERGRMISASTMPPSLRSTVMDTLAQVAWSGWLLANICVYQRLKKFGPLMDAIGLRFSLRSDQGCQASNRKYPFSTLYNPLSSRKAALRVHKTHFTKMPCTAGVRNFRHQLNDFCKVSQNYKSLTNRLRFV